MLRQSYHALAATQLSQFTVTASVFWVSDFVALETFNTFLMTLCDTSKHDYDKSLWFEYITLLHKKVNKKLLPGGFLLSDPSKTIVTNIASTNKTLTVSGLRRRTQISSAATDDSRRHLVAALTSPPKRNITAERLLPKGVPVPAVNEMTMMAFYRLKYPTQLEALPLLPWSGLVVASKHYPFKTMSTDMFAHDKENNHSLLTSGGVFDAGSYGQFLGGIPSDKLRKGFIDAGHVIGKAMIRSSCRVSMRCTLIGSGGDDKRVSFNESVTLRSDIHLYASDILQHNYQPTSTSTVKINSSTLCMTLPHVQCCAGSGTESDPECGTVTPLWNLHIHSKIVKPFISQTCEC
eukprot:gene27092-33768_t